MAEQSPENDVTASRPRPNSAWVCGRAALGHPCAAGPGKNGRCSLLQHRARRQDQQEHADGERNETQGEECAEGILSQPCQPTKSAWYSRRTLALNLALLCTGILLICMVSSQREALYVPGGLSQSHAQILGNTLVADRCSLCHPNSHDSRSGISQDALCMNCHSAHLPDAHRRSAHDLNIDELKQILVRVPTQFVPPTSEKAQQLWKQESSCAQCHREHHGKQHDLQAITNQRCQACHQQQFDSFEHGHPEFKDYPNAGSRSIAFDHRSHAEKYFTQKNQSFDCRQCHLDNAKTGVVGSVFRSVGFEKACGSCHSSPIQSELTNGWAFLQVPCLPESDLTMSREFSEWPKGAVFDYDGKVSFAMRLLLSTDSEMSAVLPKLPKSGDLSRVSQSDRPVVARKIAQSFRRLVNEIAAGGQVAWRKRLETAVEFSLGRKPNAHEQVLIQKLTIGLPPDLFRHMEKQWFQTANRIAEADSLQETLSTRLRRVSAQLNQESDESELLLGSESDQSSLELDSEEPKRQKLVRLQASRHLPEGGWYLDEQLLAVRYVAQGHADPFLAAWSELLHVLESHRDGGEGAGQSDSHSLPWRNKDAADQEFVPGSCLECHQLGKSSDANDIWVNWRAKMRPASVRQFTKFDHTPHLSLPAVNDCRYCHQLESLPSQDGNKQVLKNLLADEMNRSLESQPLANHMVHLEGYAKDYL
ncbi:MAG: hypothetical protein AAF394_12295, partial [Planctomycetota bacterium]